MLVQLPSGVRRAVPIAATSLAEPISGLGDRAWKAPAVVSIRTLLPLLHLVRALNRRAQEVPDAAGDPSTSTDKPGTAGSGFFHLGSGATCRQSTKFKSRTCWQCSSADSTRNRSRAMTVLEGAPRSLVTTGHCAKTAYVYVRQSSVSQVTRHAESTDLQYGLVERAVTLGWPRDRVEVIDDDLGKSGADSDERHGFQRLIAEIGLGHAGLVVSLDASRLARNNSDWHRLLELCGLFQTLIADAERIYDPRAYHDRLLLGLSGIMSEAELHHLKLRLHAGGRNKALRGDLRQPLPVGLARLSTGEVVVNPDEEVQARLRLVFSTFAEWGTANAVVRYLQRNHLPLPSRPLRGPAPHQIVWDRATSSQVAAILHNPAYAGAYAYGKSTRDPTRTKPGRPAPVSSACRSTGGRFCSTIGTLRTSAGTSSWPTRHVSRQTRTRTSGAIRVPPDEVRRCCKASPSAQGAARTCNCNTLGRAASSRCTSASRREAWPGPALPARTRTRGWMSEIERIVLEALTPDNLAIAVATMAEVEREDAALQSQWQLRLERGRYEAERARRQYEAVEPENRLVARNLEAQWEDKLRAVEQLEREYESWRHRQQLILDDGDRDQILALAQDLPRVWSAPTTTAAERKQLLRLLIDSVLLDNHRLSGRTWFQINWRTGAIDGALPSAARARLLRLRALEELKRRMRELHAMRLMDAAIASALNEEGFRTSHGQRFSGPMIHLLRKRWGLPTWNPTTPNPPRWPEGTYSVAAAAELLNVYPGTIWLWLRRGVLTGRQLGKGTPWHIELPQSDIARLRDRLANTQRTKPSRRPAS